ncbi:nitrite reductase (NADH) small subunit [Halopenitus malekzadehii]|uniref:Nitrite reductase (NADH) small subunit n=1 Tax=Halopenitus malekzadehii TaxID=1267564 RepID=A0A1H6JST8_9EURY|nr:Rieske 2Fe-2S domain-containing protein [Halopenitus malekzadehii]SEH65631.1 nitrite reductase (NADH) small subunit [Halopenitus malekzadehii]
MSSENVTVDDAFTKVATTEEIPQGTGIGVDVDGIEIAVYNVEGEFYAISNRCAHQRAPLCKAGDKKINAEHTWTDTRGGVNEESCTVSCPWHLWEWDLETGEHEASGQRIGTFDTHVEDQDVYVRI